MNVWRRSVVLTRPAAPAPVILPPQPRVTLPLLWGETALVRVGEQVNLGQKIADGAGDIVPLHASISGTVTAIAPRTCARGRRYPSIVIQNDDRMQPDPSLRGRPLLDDLTDEALLTLLYEAGIRLPDGTPLAAALSDAGPGVQTMIVSAMDLEPNLCTEDAVLCHDTEAAFSGIRVLERLARPQRIILAAGSGQKAAIRAAERWTGQRLELAVTADPYPAAHPQLLAQMLGGLKPGQTPREGGVLTLPVSAAAAAGRAAYEGIPSIRQTICVDLDGTPVLISAPLGVPISAVLRAAGHTGQPMLLGGPMTGVLLEDCMSPVTKGMTGLTALPRTIPGPMTHCIRCGQCARVCPMGLQPWLSQFPGRQPLWTGCIRCGACQYSCPARQPLLRAMTLRGREPAGVD